MATINAINSANPIEVAKGGLGASSHTAYSPLSGGTTATGALQSIGTGSNGDVLTSAGGSALPTWGTLPTFFEPLASDPGAPADGDTWFNTTTELFKGRANGATVTFTVT